MHPLGPIKAVNFLLEDNLQLIPGLDRWSVISHQTRLSKVSQGSLKGVSKRVHEYLRSILWEFQGCLIGVSGIYKWHFKCKVIAKLSPSQPANPKLGAEIALLSVKFLTTLRHDLFMTCLRLVRDIFIA